MIGELTGYIRTTPPQDVWKDLWAAWKHGVIVLIILTLAFAAVMLAAAVVWFAVNAIPLVLIDSWTLERSYDACSWTFVIWLPIAYSIGARYLPPDPDEGATRL